MTYANPTFVGSAPDAVNAAVSSDVWTEATPVLAVLDDGFNLIYSYVSVLDANATIDKYAGSGKGSIPYSVDATNTVWHELLSIMGGASYLISYNYYSSNPVTTNASILILK